MNFFRLGLAFAIPLFLIGCGPTTGGGGAEGGGAEGGAGEGGGTCDTDNGCGHPIEECPDPNDPTVHYLSEDPEQCGLTDCGGPETDCVPCSGDQEYFQDECGCGCIDIPPPPEPTCPDPNDPAVHYISEDPAQCIETDCGPETDCIPCGPDQAYFDDECGCGCIDTEG
jgi:hypothetical protein